MVDKVLCKQGILPQGTVVRIGCQLCLVLSYLHTRQPPIVYLDIKPSNVILRDENKLSVSLFDFGIAIRCGTDADQCDKPRGTKGFAAPEQNKPGSQLDARTDIFGLGATMYTLLTGRNPAADGRIYPITCWDSRLSGELEQIILRCVQEDPEDRYQSCETLRQDLLNCDISNEPMRFGNGQNLPSFYGDRRCRHCWYSPLSCAPVKRRKGEEICHSMGWDRTEDLDATVLLEESDCTDGGVNLEKAKCKLQFLPDVKIIVCGTDMWTASHEELCRS